MVQGMMASAGNALPPQAARGIPGPGLAAIRAPYSAKTASVIGHQNLRKLHVLKKIEEARAKRAERCEVTADWVVDELRKIADVNMADYMKSIPSGDPLPRFFGFDA